MPAWRNAYALRLERSAFGIASSSLAAGTKFEVCFGVAVAKW